MTRDELKHKLGGLIDSIVDDDRELTEEDEDKLNDNLGSELMSDLLVEDDDSETGEADATKG